MSINTNIPVAGLTYNGEPLAFVAAAAGEDTTWMEEPVLTITIEEECKYIYIDSINGEPFDFEEMAGNYVLQGVTGTEDGQLCFAPKKITASYSGFLITSTNSTAKQLTKGVFQIKYDMLKGWYTEMQSNMGNTWLSGKTAVYRHITHNQPDSAGYRPFGNITSITKFTIIPYSGNLHPGTVINIYGKPLKKEV